MASGKKHNQEYDDALGSIFDFMFSEANKPPDKRKPIKPTGISGTSEFTDALGMVLENPAAFVSNTTMEAIDGALDEKLIEIQTDSRGNNLEITTTGLIGLVKDPNKFLQKAYDKQKMMRKSSHIRWFSPSIQGVIMNAYGSKIGLDGFDSKLLGQATQVAMSEKQFQFSENKKGNTFQQEYGLRSPFGQRNLSTTLEFDGLRDNQPGFEVDAFNKIYDEKFGLGSDPQLESIERRRFEQLVRSKKAQGKSITNDDLKNFFIRSPNLTQNQISKARAFWKEPKHISAVWENDSFDRLAYNFEQKAEAQRQQNPEKAEAYEKASAYLFQLKEKKIIDRSPIALRELREQIKANPNDPRIREWKKEEVLLRGLIRQKRIGQLGQAEGFVDAWNATYRNAKDLVPNILNGSFFDSKKHKNPFLSPSEIQKVAVGGHTIEVHVARTMNNPYSPQFADALNSMYYFTPAGIVATLTHGEGFSKAFINRARRLEKTFGSLSNSDKMLLGTLGIWNVDDECFDIGKLSEVMANPQELNALMGVLGRNPNSPLAGQLTNFIQKNQNILKWADRLNWGGKFQAFSKKTTQKVLFRILGITDKKTKDALAKHTAGQIISNRIGERILNSSLGAFMRKYLSEEVMEQIGKNVALGSLKAVLKGLIEAALLASGVATGGASVMAWAGTEVVFQIGYRAIQYIILLILLIGLGLLGLMGIGIGSIGAGADFIYERMNVHSHILPTEVEQCPVYIPLEFDGDTLGSLEALREALEALGLSTAEINAIIATYEANPSNLASILSSYGLSSSQISNIVAQVQIGGGPIAELNAGPLPDGVTCLLGTAGSYNCTQGAYGHWSHQNVAANDYGYVGSFFAPQFCSESAGNCTVTFNGPINCTAGYAGGMVILDATYEGSTYTFKLIHVESPLSVGETLGSGDEVALIMKWTDDGSERDTSACSSGTHLHLETKVNGSTVDPYEVMTSPASQGGFGCNISTCPL